MIIELNDNNIPTFNKVINEAKTHWSKYSKPKATFTDMACVYAKAQLVPVRHPPVDFEFTWYWRNKRTDKDNIATIKKWILDGLALAKIIDDDNWHWIGNFADKFAIDKHNPRVEVLLKETNDK